MCQLSERQIKFFELLKSIQETAVIQSINEMNKHDSLEDVLFNATYEVIASICEVLDGYNNHINLELMDKDDNIPLRSGIELHDICAKYIRCENPYKNE